MWVERVSLENFLAFKTVSVELAPGFNVVLSPNEGGKSSLFQGILAGLYASAASQKNEVLSLARWGAGGSFRIEVDFRLREESYRAVRDFGAKALYRGSEKSQVAKWKGMDEYLSAHLPIADRDLFLRVCGVRHEELGLVGEGASGLGEKIEEILGGGWGHVTPAKVERIVDAKRKELVRGRDRPVIDTNRGAVKRFMDEVSLLEREAARASALAAIREGLLKAASAVDARLAAVDAQLEILKARRDKASEHRSLEEKERAQREKADGLRKRIERIRELLDRRQTIASEGKRVPALLRAVDGSSLDALRDDLAREVFLEEEATAGKPASGLGRHWRPVLASILALGGVLGALVWKSVMLVFLAVGLGLFVWHAAARRGGAGVPPAEQRDELERLRKKRALWAEGRSLEESKALLAECGSRAGRVREVETRLEEAAGKETCDIDAFLAALDEEYGGAAVELRALKEARSALEPFRFDGSETLRLDRDIADRERERERIAAERDDRARDLAALEHLDANAIAERLAEAREGLERSERKVRLLDAILGTLEEARRNVSGFLARELPPLAGAYLSRITGGRYGTLFVDALTMKIEAVPAVTDAGVGSGIPERVEPFALSQGARDQIYFAVRLALVELMSRGESQPIFLDDPFVHFDPERGERSLDILREFAGRHQVVLFTCNPRYRGAGDRLIELAER